MANKSTREKELETLIAEQMSEISRLRLETEQAKAAVAGEKLIQAPSGDLYRQTPRGHERPDTIGPTPPAERQYRPATLDAVAAATVAGMGKQLGPALSEGRLPTQATAKQILEQAVADEQ
jgi:hypothetical protein